MAGAVFANRAQPVSASDVLDQLQAEAYGAIANGPCPGPDAPHATGGALVIEWRASATRVGQGASPDAGPVTATNATDLSERLARALGVSGERVRQAMVATVRAGLPALPQEPIASIAQQLGKTPVEVCAAFLDPQSSAGDHLFVSELTAKVTSDRPAPHSEAVFGLGGKAIDLNSASADELSGPASRLGVSPERLLGALRAATPSTPPPPPPSEDEIITGLAGNLGMSQDQVRAAIKQVGGNGPFYFVVPLPGMGR
jgi:hypothetical protein